MLIHVYYELQQLFGEKGLMLGICLAKLYCSTRSELFIWEEKIQLSEKTKVTVKCLVSAIFEL